MLTEEQKDTYLSYMEVRTIISGDFEKELEIFLSNIRYDKVKEVEKLIREGFKK